MSATDRTDPPGAAISMKISAKAEYACLALLALARQGPTRRRCASARSRKPTTSRAVPGADPAPAQERRAGSQHARRGGRLSPGAGRVNDLGGPGPFGDRRPRGIGPRWPSNRRPAAASSTPCGQASAPPSAPCSIAPPSTSLPNKPRRTSGSSDHWRRPYRSSWLASTDPDNLIQVISSPA